MFLTLVLCKKFFSKCNNFDSCTPQTGYKLLTALLSKFQPAKQ